MVILAELEVFHSRPVAPTRRVALGRTELPVDPPPGSGGVLLGGVVAHNVGVVDPDLIPELARLTVQLEHGQRIAQPRLRYRFQTDRIGLQRSRHRLLREANSLRFEFDDEHGDPSQQLLGAVYAAGQLPMRLRRPVMAAVRRSISWRGAVGPEFIAMLSGFDTATSWSANLIAHPVEWALDVLGFHRHGERSVEASVAQLIDSGTQVAEHTRHSGTGPTPSAVQRRYRQLLMAAHPDHGGHAIDAAQRIADLSEARRILLGLTG